MKKLLVLFAGALLLLGQQHAKADEQIHLWFPPHFKATPDRVQKIAGTLNKKGGLHVVPHIANSFTELLAALDGKEPEFVYAGSFIQAMIQERRLGKPLVQAVDGKEFYGSVMLFPKGGNPEAILRENPAEIAFAVATSAGESSAKAATGGKAGVRMPHHAAAAAAVREGKAKAAFVKDWWWEANKGKMPELDAFTIPGISDRKDPDNVLAASRNVPETIAAKMMAAALASPEAFNARAVVPFDVSTLDFSRALLKKAGIDPATYSWSE